MHARTQRARVCAHEDACRRAPTPRKRRALGERYTWKNRKNDKMRGGRRAREQRRAPDNVAVIERRRRPGEGGHPLRDVVEVAAEAPPARQQQQALFHLAVSCHVLRLDLLCLLAPYLAVATVPPPHTHRMHARHTAYIPRPPCHHAHVCGTCVDMSLVHKSLIPCSHYGCLEKG